MVVVTGLDAAFKVTSVFTSIGLGGGGEASVITQRNSQTETTITGEIGKTIVITDSTYGNNFFKGEIYNATIGTNEVVWKMKEGSRKLLTNYCLYNPILVYGIVDRVDESTIFDRGLDISGYANKLLVMQRNFNTEQKLFPSSYDWVDNVGGTLTPDGQSGNIKYLYFNDVTLADNLNAMNAYVDPAVQSYPDWRLLMNFSPFLKSGSTVETINILAAVRFRKLDVFDITYPTLLIYNYVTPGWETLETFNADFDLSASDGNDDFGYSQTPQHIVNIDVSGTLTDYLSEINTANESDFVEYQIRLAVSSGNVSGFVIETVHVDYIKVTVETDTAQIPLESVGVIDSTSLNEVTCKTSTAINELDDFPVGDGFSGSDEFKIVNDADTVLVSCWSNSGINFTLDSDDLANNIALSEDLTDMSLFSLLQKLAIASEMVFYYDQNTKIYLQKGFSHCDVTLTRSDILSYDSFVFNINGEGIRDRIVIKGNELIRHETNTSPEITHTLEDETLLVTDSEIYTSAEARAQALTFSAKTEKPVCETTVVLDYTDPYQSYTNIALGKYISMGLPTTSDKSLLDYLTTPLLINGMSLRWSKVSGDRDFVTLSLERHLISSWIYDFADYSTGDWTTVTEVMASSFETEAGRTSWKNTATNANDHYRKYQALSDIRTGETGYVALICVRLNQSDASQEGPAMWIQTDTSKFQLAGVYVPASPAVMRGQYDYNAAARPSDYSFNSDADNLTGLGNWIWVGIRYTFGDKVEFVASFPTTDYHKTIPKNSDLSVYHTDTANIQGAHKPLEFGIRNRLVGAGDNSNIAMAVVFAI